MKKLNFKRAIVLGGSKGLGASIAKELKKSCKVVTALSSKDIDTSDLQSVKNFLRRFKSSRPLGNGSR